MFGVRKLPFDDEDEVKENHHAEESDVGPAHRVPSFCISYKLRVDDEEVGVQLNEALVCELLPVEFGKRVRPVPSLID